MKKIITSLILTAAFLVFPNTAFGFGITPAEINVSNLKPGSHYETEIFVTRPPDEVNEALQVVLEPQLGEMESWFQFVPGREFQFPDGENVTSFRVVVDVPQDIELKNYKGRITAKGLTDERAAEGVTIIKGAILGIDFTASAQESAVLKVLSIKAPEVNSGDPVSLNLMIENSGNEAAAPDRVNLEVMDVFENPLESLSDSTLENIEPFTTKEIKAEFNSNLEQGQYRVDAAVIYEGNEIARERMILTVNAKPAQIDEAEQPQTSQVAAFDNTLGMLLTVLGVLLLVIILVLFLRKEKDSDPEVEKRLSHLLHKDALLTWMLIGVSLAMIFAGFYISVLPGSGRAVVEEQDEVLMEEESMEMMGDEVEESTEAAEVQGVSVEITETPVVEEESSDEQEDTSFRIERPGTPGLYPIFAEASFGSEIIYEAEPGETFDANFLEDGWYRVVLEDGTQGWLHETSISKK